MIANDPLRTTARVLPPVLVLAAVVAVFAGCLGDDQTRHDALAALARWEDRRLAPHDSLVAMLDHTDAHVRLAATRTAGLIGRDDALLPLLARLEDPSLTVQRQACFSLGILGDTLAVPALEAVARDPRPAQRLAALGGLARVPNRGTALLAATTGPSAEAAAAWNALRNQTDRVPRAALLDALRAGLTAADPDVLWRVLRCVELAADSSLVPLVVPHARSDRAQVRVHACRALARLGGAAALAAVLETAADHGFRGRDGVRVDVTVCRALGTLGAAAPADRLPAVAVRLIEAAGSSHPHVAATALDAMASVTAARTLPPEAADRESLLPVWRIRLARSAADHLDDEDSMVRAAAVGAYAAVRGPGALEYLAAGLADEPSAPVVAARVRALGTLAGDPCRVLAPFLGPALFDAAPETTTVAAGPWMRHGLVGSAALDALAANGSCPGHNLWSRLVDTMTRANMPGATDAEHVMAATALGYLGAHPDDPTARGVVAFAARASGPWRADMVLAALDCLQEMFAASDSVWTPWENTRAETAGLVARSFDDRDVRIRLAAREFAVAAALLPDNLVPTEASLRATMPAVVRSPLQPPVAVPFDAPKIRGTSTRGDFVVELDPEIAPNTCAMFLDLVAAGFYDGLTFHRVVADFVVQGGDPSGTGWGGPGYTIRSEWSDRPYTRGVVGIAHSGKDTGGSQFFVTLSEQPHLVGRYTIFAKVTRGLENFDAMQPGDTFSLAVAD